MPKAIFHDENWGAFPEASSTLRGTEQLAVLTWGRDAMHVQLGVGASTMDKARQRTVEDNLLGQFKRAIHENRVYNVDHACYQAGTDGLERAQADAAALEAVPEDTLRLLAREMTRLAGHEMLGWWITLDRARINEMIRQLRRARDQAYGADA